MAPKHSLPRYVQLADDIAAQIQADTLRPGERLPSVRNLSAARGFSQSTVMNAYYLLEDRGLISTRPRSGYFVNARPRPPLEAPRAPVDTVGPLSVAVEDLLFEVLEGMKSRSLAPLGSAFPSPHLFPLPRLAKRLSGSARRLDPEDIVEGLPPGNIELRRHVARRYMEYGAPAEVGDIVITAGAAEALVLCLHACTQPGDVVAIESPAFYGVLHAIETLDRRAVCIPSCPSQGMDLKALGEAVQTQDVRAVWAMPNFQNPTGALMSVAKKQELVALLSQHDIPLIEDDAYAELYFGRERPPPAKAFDRHGLVLHCGSFSKSLAPGYRVGWASAGRFSEAVRRHKFLFSISTNVIAQAAIADFVSTGSYERHLRKLRSTLLSQRDSLLRAITRHFPANTCVSRPEGGYFVWIELPPGSPDAMHLSRLCVADGVSISPGRLFSPREEFESFLRLSFGHPWTPRLESAVQTMGRHVHDGLRSHT